MIGILRLMLFALVGLAIVYLLVVTYFCSVRREELEKEWDANPPAGDGATERDLFIDSEVKTYARTLKKRLIWLVFILPMIIFTVIVYFVNAQ